MRGIRDWLCEQGHEVTSRWINRCSSKYLNSPPSAILNTDPEYCATLARNDIDDLRSSDVVISFFDTGGNGVKHVEFGMALALGKRVILVGHREHVFHTLPEVEHYDTWKLAAASLLRVTNNQKGTQK
jgi:hypothetical protein